MRRSISIILILSMLLVFNAGTVCATAISLSEAIALDLLSAGPANDATDDSSNKNVNSAKQWGSWGKASEERIVTGSKLNAVEALVQSYTPADDEYKGKQMELNSDSRFFIDSKEEPAGSLLNSVSLMEAEFASVELPGDAPLGIVHAEAKFSQPGDIVIQLVDEMEFHPGCDAADIEEAYRIEINDRINITVCDAKGAYYALLTIMEMGLERNDGSGTIKYDCCTICDGPDVAERTLMLDCGRKYFSKEWIENLIKRASVQRYNAVELHFSEAECLRFDSANFPWLTEGVKSLSREDMTEIIKLAKTYNIEIIPSMDTPGHNEYIVKKYAEHIKANPGWSFGYGGKNYNRDNTKGFSSIANYYSYNGEKEKADYIGIDISSEHARAFMDALIDDYADYFRALGCSKFNIGGDELLGWYSFDLGDKRFYYENRWESLEHWGDYAKQELKQKNGSASDTFVDYINNVATRLEDKGFSCRVFNDEININDDQHIKLKKSIEIIMWSKGAANYTSITEAGHRVHIDSEQWTYYVVRQQNGEDIMSNKYSNVNAEAIYKSWNPLSFTTKSGNKRTPDVDQMAGAYFNIWCDSPGYKSSKTIWEETSMRTWANASKMWNVELSTSESGIGRALSYDSFENFVKLLKGFPGYSGNPNESSRLVEPNELISGMSFWDKIFGFAVENK